MTHQPAHQPPSRLGAWIAVVIGGLYFLLPLLATFEFSLKMLREGYSFAAYQAVLQDPGFQQSFAYSVLMALLTIVIGILLVAPTAFWIQLKLPRLRPLVEFITLLPLVIPAIVIVFGYLRLFGSDAWSPLTGSERGTDLLLVCSYVTLALPYLYRSIDAGLSAIDVRSLAEAAQSLGGGWRVILLRVIFPISSPRCCPGPF